MFMNNVVLSVKAQNSYIVTCDEIGDEEFKKFFENNKDFITGNKAAVKYLFANSNLVSKTELAAAGINYMPTDEDNIFVNLDFIPYNL